MMNEKNRTPADDRPGLDELEPLEEHSGERQEPEDDYYIRNYVLKETTQADKTTARAEGEAPPAPAVGANAPEPSANAEPRIAAVPETMESPESPAFGSRAFGPVGEPGTERVAVPQASAGAGGLSRAERLTNVLTELLESSPNIEAAVLVSMDGLAMASALPDHMQEDRVAAMSAAILGLGERASAELGRGVLDQVFVEGADGYVFLMSAGGRAVLTALADRGVKIGLVFYDMKDAAAKIADAL